MICLCIFSLSTFILFLSWPWWGVKWAVRLNWMGWRPWQINAWCIRAVLRHAGTQIWVWVSAWVFQGRQSKTPRTGRASTTEMYFLTVLEAPGPRSRCHHSRFLLRPLSLACRRPPSPYVLRVFSLCACVFGVSLRPIFFFLKGYQIGLGSTLRASISLTTSLKAVSPNAGTWGGGGSGGRASTCGWVGDAVGLITVSVTLFCVSPTPTPLSTPHRAPCSLSPPPRWSITPQDSSPSPTPPSCPAATAVGFRPSAGVARRKPQALKIRWTNSRWRRGRGQATAGPRSRCAGRARRRRRTACTSGLCGARSRYLTAWPSPSRRNRPPCPPSLWRRDRDTWRTGPGGRTPARGPDPCPGKSPSYKKSLSYFPAMNSLPFTRNKRYGEKTFSVGTLITYSDLSLDEWN